MADADFGIRGEATLDTSSAEKSATGLSDKLGDALDKSGQKMSLFASLGKKATDGLTVAIGNFETKIAQAAVQAVQQVVSTGLEFNRQMENYQLAFENLLGSAEAANAALDAIKADAASTPFDVAGLVSANRLLISTGQSADEARETINALGNAVSASGGGNAELERMAANLQQIANVGEASAVDIRQFAYAGIDIYGLLADYTGLAKDEVQGLTISYDLLTDALKAASEEGGRYAGAMEAYSQTLQGRMDTLADNATQLAGALTEGLFEAQKGLVEAASGWVETLQTTLEAEGPARRGQYRLCIPAGRGIGPAGCGGVRRPDRGAVFAGDRAESAGPPRQWRADRRHPDRRHPVQPARPGKLCGRSGQHHHRDPLHHRLAVGGLADRLRDRLGPSQRPGQCGPVHP